MSLELKQVVVTGLGAITLVGNPVKEYWKKLPGVQRHWFDYFDRCNSSHNKSKSKESLFSWRY